MNKLFLIAILFVGYSVSGCYNAKVVTNEEPSAKIVEESFAHGFVFGLVGPTVDVSDKCTNGVAKVETKLSFVNMLVSNITFGLYTPMNIKVTCAAGSTAQNLESSGEKTVTIEKDASEVDIQQTYQEVANEVIENGGAMYIQYE